MLNIQKQLTNSFYALLSLPATAMGFALSVQIAALSWLLSTKYGLEIHDVGLVWAAGPIAGIVGQVLIGFISDQVWFMGGRRKPFIFIGGFLAALMLLALPNIDIISGALGMDGILGVAIAVALTLDLSINVSFNPTRSIIADLTPEGQERTKGYTWMQTISGTFGVLAYVISVWLGNYTLIYFGAALVFFLSVIPPLFIEESRDLVVASEAEPASSPAFSLGDTLRSILPLWGFLLYGIYGIVAKLLHYEPAHFYVEYLCLGLSIGLIAYTLLQRESGRSVEVASRIGFQKILAAHSFTWLGVQTMFVYMFAYLQDKYQDMSADDLGEGISIAFLILNAVAAVLPALLLEPIALRQGRVRTHTFCLAAMTLGYLGILYYGADSLLSINLMMAVVGVGWAATVSLPFAIMSQKVDKTQMGLYMGLFNLSVVLPQLVASLGIGELISRAPDKNVIFMVCAGSLLISTLSWSLVKESEGAEEVALTGGGGGH
ncbi:MAG: MFS transporter [Bacteroidota bacterium]